MPAHDQLRTYPFSTWLAVVGLSLGTAVATGYARFAYGLILPAMRHDLGWSYIQAGWINTANALGYLVGSAATLALIRRYGTAELFRFGMILTSLALIVSSMTESIIWLSLWRFLSGAGGAPVFISGGVIASGLFAADRERNAVAIAIFCAGGGLGILLSGLTIPILLEAKGSSYWPMAWLIIGVLSLFFTACSFRALRQIAPKASAAVIGKTQQSLPIRQMSASLLGYILFAVGYIVFFTFLVAWMRETMASTLNVITTWSALGIGAILAPFVWKSELSRRADGRPLALACAMTGVGVGLPLLIPHPGITILSALVFGLSFFAAPAAITSFSKKNLDEPLWGAAIALYTTLFAAGQAIGPVAAGLISDATHSLTLGLIAAAAILGLGALVSSRQRILDKNCQLDSKLSQD